MKFIFLLFGLTMIFFSAKAQSLEKGKSYQFACVGFWNIENLYDTINQPENDDEEFTPEGKNKWFGKRYWIKIDHNSDAISQMGTESSPDGLVVMGLCEIENKSVVADLIAAPKLKSRNYQIVHYEGPDKRGVDCALIYNPKYFKVTNSKSYTLINPEEEKWRTRDQLLVSGLLLGEQVHFIVNHWPSRRGGEEKSESKRILAAKMSRRIIDSLLLLDPNAKIIHMGDLNDDPVNVSCKDVMKGKKDFKNLKNDELFNTMASKHSDGIGSLGYNDAWNLFDQMMVSNNLAPIENKFSEFKFLRSVVFNKPFLQQKDGRYKGYPFRTYSGGAFTAGYSDHFPVYLVLAKEVAK